MSYLGTLQIVLNKMPLWSTRKNIMNSYIKQLPRFKPGEITFSANNFFICGIDYLITLLQTSKPNDDLLMHYEHNILLILLIYYLTGGLLDYENFTTLNVLNFLIKEPLPYKDINTILQLFYNYQLILLSEGVNMQLSFLSPHALNVYFKYWCSKFNLNYENFTFVKLAINPHLVAILKT